MDDNKKPHKLPSLKISSAFKMSLCFITFVAILYFILIKRDIMAALFLLNIIANYRIMLSFMTDWNDEIIFKENILNNDSHGFSSTRNIYDTQQTADQDASINTNVLNNKGDSGVLNNKGDNVSNFISYSDIDGQSYKYLNSVYEDKINYNYENYDTNFAWWSEH